MAATSQSFSLIIAYPGTKPGLVSGPWLQDCSRGLEEAKARCAGTSQVNGGMAIALVPRFGGPTAMLDGECVRDVTPLFVAGDLSKMSAFVGA